MAGTFGYAASSQGNTVTTSGALTLNTSSTLDFGSGRIGSNNNILSFSLLSTLAAGVNLTITDYLSSATYALGATTASAASQDGLQLANIYGSSLGTQLSQIVFYNSAGTQIGYGEEVSFAGGYEIVPITAAPEPSTILAGLVFVGMLVWSQWEVFRLYWAKSGHLRFGLGSNGVLRAMHSFILYQNNVILNLSKDRCF